MKFSDKTVDLIFKINEFSGKRVKNVFEVSFLIESALSSEIKRKEFEDLIFTAKYVNGLKSVLSNRIITGNEYMEKMFDEFNKNFQKFLDQLKVMTFESMNKQYTGKYFALDQQSINNSMELIEDLSLCKTYFNENPADLIQ